MLEANPIKDQEILDKLEKDIQDWSEVVERNKKFGIHLNPDPNILKRRTYSKFVILSRPPEDKHDQGEKRKLSDVALKWMGEFAEKGPYEDIRKYLNNHSWVIDYRRMKAQK